MVGMITRKKIFAKNVIGRDYNKYVMRSARSDLIGNIYTRKQLDSVMTRSNSSCMEYSKGNTLYFFETGPGAPMDLLRLVGIDLLESHK